MGKSKVVFVKYNDDQSPIEIDQDTNSKSIRLELVNGGIAVERKISPQTGVVTDTEASPSPIPTPQASPQDDSALVNSKIFSKLKAAVDSQGAAFSQFTEMLGSLSDVITNEAMLYAAALKAVNKSYKVTADQIIHSVDARMKALLTESKNFSDSIDQNKKELAKYETQMKEKDLAIETLKKRILSFEAEKKDVERTIEKRRAKYETDKKEFDYAVEVLKNKLAKEKDVLQKYLK